MISWGDCWPRMISCHYSFFKCNRSNKRSLLTDFSSVYLGISFQICNRMKQDKFPKSKNTVYQRTPDIAIDLSRKLGRGALRGQYFSVVFFFRVNTLKYSVSNFHSSRLDINEWLLE